MTPPPQIHEALNLLFTEAAFTYLVAKWLLCSQALSVQFPNTSVLFHVEPQEAAVCIMSLCFEFGFKDTLHFIVFSSLRKEGQTNECKGIQEARKTSVFPTVFSVAQRGGSLSHYTVIFILMS